MDYDKKSSLAFVQLFDLPPYQSGVLSNLTFSVKDLIDIAGYKTGCGNPDWEKHHPPAVASAVCIEQLLQSGASCVGKTICDEFAFGLLGENAFYGTPINPKAPDRIPGGSSSGSASSVACGIVDFSIGTDTGGSVRVPASNCGIFGFRPSHGRISVAGVIPCAPSFDTVGFFAREADVLKKVATVLLGGFEDTSPQLQEICILEEAFSLGTERVRVGLQAPLEKMQRLLPFSKCLFKNIFQNLSSLEELNSIFWPLQWSEFWNSYGSWIEEVHPQMGAHTAKNFELARNFDRKKIQDAVQKRKKIKNAINQFLGSNRLFCIPTTPALAPIKKTIPLDRTKSDYYPRLLALDAIASLASLPQITLPVGSFNSIPIGLSFLASHGNDEFLIQKGLEIFLSLQ